MNIGRFNTQKNQLFLLDIFAEIIKQNNNYQLFLVGLGDLEAKLKQKVKDLNLQEKVHFLGLRNDVPELLQAMDVFLFQVFEGFSVSFVEAQTTGIKCVISDGVPVESVLVKENVQVISLKENAEQWANKILEIKNFERKDVSEIIKKKAMTSKKTPKN
jgi:glycosyltransferase involved in cell wall biosynthesis